MWGVSMNHNRIVLKGTNKRDAAGFLLFVFLLPYVCACLWGHVGEQTNALRQEGWQEELSSAPGGQVEIIMDWGIWELPVEEYLVYKLESVMPDSYEPEALKAQAVLLRTELMQAVKEQGSARMRFQSDGLEKWYHGTGKKEEKLQPCIQAVKETAGVYLCYQGEPVQASYFKVSNGQTRDAKEVWHNQNNPYLTSVSCPQDQSAPDYRSEVTVSKANYLYQIRARIGEGYSAQDLWEGIRFDYDSAGYVTKASFYEGENPIGEMDGETFRYIFSLPSSSFEMEQKDTKIVFRVTGVGHGFGMSQYGANSRALNGETYRQILEDFFPGTELAKFE